MVEDFLFTKTKKIDLECYFEAIQLYPTQLGFFTEPIFEFIHEVPVSSVGL